MMDAGPTVPPPADVDRPTQLAALQRENERLQDALASWAEAAVRDQHARTAASRAQLWALVEAQGLQRRADAVADARQAQRLAEQRAMDAERERDTARAERDDRARLLAGDHEALARRLAVAREVWALASNAADLLTLGGQIGRDAARDQLQILLHNRVWSDTDGHREARLPGDGPIPLDELGQVSQMVAPERLGRVVHAARCNAARRLLWSAPFVDTAWDALPATERAVCISLGELVACAGAAGAYARAYALEGALDDAAWILRGEHPERIALALARLSAPPTRSGDLRAAGAVRRTLEGVCAAASGLRAAIAGCDAEGVTWMEDPAPYLAALDAALDQHDAATANGADTLADPVVHATVARAIADIEAGPGGLATALLALLADEAIADALRAQIRAALRRARRGAAQPDAGDPMRFRHAFGEAVGQVLRGQAEAGRPVLRALLGAELATRLEVLLTASAALLPPLEQISGATAAVQTATAALAGYRPPAEPC